MLRDLRQKTRGELWTPNLRPVNSIRGDSLPEVFLPNPVSKKGTTQYKAWAMECFLELLRHGYNFSQAAERLGYTFKWWTSLSMEHPDFAEEARAIRGGTDFTDDAPNMEGVSFEDFVRNYFGVELAEHQKEMARTLEDPMAKLVLILGHPESGKSTLVSLWYVVYKLCKNPDIRIALVAKSGPKAQDLLNRIKRYLTEEHLYENTPRNLIADFHGFKPPHGDMEWSQDAIFIRQRKSGERDPTIQALGLRKQIYGVRLDLLILDDALVLDNQTSELERERIDVWFTNEARSRAHYGQTVVNGTRLFPPDLYGQWKKSWRNYHLFRGVYIPAILDEYTDQERPTWPEYWSLDGRDEWQTIDGEDTIVGYKPGLRDIREEICARDPNRWRLVYQQEDVEQASATFTQAHVDLALELGAGRPMGRVYDHEILILGVDPATSGRAAAVLLAFDPSSRIRTVIDIFVGSALGTVGLRNELFYKFWDKYKTHRVNHTVIETNFTPTLIGDETFVMRAEAAGTRLVAHQTVGRGSKRGSKWDEEYGVGAMASLFSAGLVAFANDGLDDEARLRPLIEDLLVFPWADVQDTVMALWFANTEASVNRFQQIDQQAAMKRRGLPPIVVALAKERASKAGRS
jgi:hypothetical protein